MSEPSRRASLGLGVFAVACLMLTKCSRPYRSEGERLAHTYCAACHMFPEPALLDKKTWRTGVLPQMALRLGVPPKSLFAEMHRDPEMVVLTKAVSEPDWETIVAHYLEHAPDTLPQQSLPAQPQVDPPLFSAGPFVPRLHSSAIITLLKTDTVNERIFVGEAGTNTFRVFDFDRYLKASLTLGSPPTDVISERDRLLVLESGMLEPNDQPKGTLVQYDFARDGSLHFSKVLIDSLFRPVFVKQFDFAGHGRKDFVICEFGNNRGRLALYREDGATYQRHVLDATPGAIRFEILDLTGDGFPDIVALFGNPSPDRKSTRLNSSHLGISYAVFCLKKKKQHNKEYEGQEPRPAEEGRGQGQAGGAEQPHREARATDGQARHRRQLHRGETGQLSHHH